MRSPFSEPSPPKGDKGEARTSFPGCRASAGKSFSIGHMSILTPINKSK
jgi:hypothetical protein